MNSEEKDCLKEVESFDKTGFNYTLSLISGKYNTDIKLSDSTACRDI